MNNKGVRVAIEAVLVVVLVLVGRAMAGVFGDFIIVLGLVVLICAIVDLFTKRK